MTSCGVTDVITVLIMIASKLYPTGNQFSLQGIITKLQFLTMYSNKGWASETKLSDAKTYHRLVVSAPMFH